jgi:hypothetical protein
MDSLRLLEPASAVQDMAKEHELCAQIEPNARACTAPLFWFSNHGLT